ncbi:MAG: hypothetical protein ABI946_00810 [Chthoniobacterales bacterium]
MNRQQLAINTPQESGVLELSDGSKYLIHVEDQSTAARWQTGQLLEVTPELSRPSEFELIASDAPTEVVRAKRFSS